MLPRIDATSHDKAIARFLIIGETVESEYTLNRWDYVNIVVSIVFFTAVGILTPIVISLNPLWFLFLFVLTIIGGYYGFQTRKSQVFIVTKYRLIKLDSYPMMNRVFRSESFANYQDIHYEHVESISFGYPSIDHRRFWISISLLSIAWAIYQSQENLFVGEAALLPITLVFIIVGVISFLTSLPLSRFTLQLTSISGNQILIPANLMDNAFLEELVQNCRVFLSFGGE